jgi:hypothetical protein
MACASPAITKLEIELATSHGTATGTFKLGAYVTDPVKPVRMLNVTDKPLVIGGDFGGGSTKLGVGYFDRNNIFHFACLVVADCKDDWEGLSSLNESGITPFVGESAGYSSIWAVLQSFIKRDPRTMLNGDWPFINAVRGLKTPSARHPCPICVIKRKMLGETAPFRLHGNNHSRKNPPLLRIDHWCIVPTPLHVFLGIANRLVDKGLTKKLGADAVAAIVSPTKTKHVPGNTGRSDFHGMNGRELTRFIKRAQHGHMSADEALTVAEAALASSSDSTVVTMVDWMRRLRESLLVSGWLDRKKLDALSTLHDDINKNWCKVTGDKFFPKLHMLRHCAEFAEKYRFLGAVAESQIESYHAAFNLLLNRSHRNKAHQPHEAMRRALADASVRAVQPLLLTQ